ncbi:hypothetical protein BDF19DRAFT_454713 [Syncephalis fuscata]|nr:hypothetical protein BDF19DRAFT_454713 [Syncephalis fuscata]
MPLPFFQSSSGGRNQKSNSSPIRSHMDWIKTTISSNTPSIGTIVAIVLIHGIVIALLSSGIESNFTTAMSKGVTTQPINTDLLCSVNRERMKKGLSALGVDAALTRAAQIHSNAQAKAKTMSHQLPGQPTPSQRVDAQNSENVWVRYGENVAYGWVDVPTVMMRWMNSPGHRANILAYTKDNVPYWTQEFGHNDKIQSFPICPSSTSTKSLPLTDGSQNSAQTKPQPPRPATEPSNTVSAQSVKLANDNDKENDQSVKPANNNDKENVQPSTEPSSSSIPADSTSQLDSNEGNSAPLPSAPSSSVQQNHYNNTNTTPNTFNGHALKQ